ncbi:MAG: TetR/AcrR family transcriptional regulator [Streptosporangiaceae bacterium]
MDAPGDPDERGDPGDPADFGAEPWPFYPHTHSHLLSGRETRRAEHERRVAGHVQRHRERGAQPRPRDRGLSRAEIISTAITIADAEGPEALSMRRIARELRVGAMSLYWHIASKEELLDLMLEAIQAEVEVPEPSGDWQADLRVFARSARASLLRHRWAMEFIGGRPPSGPNDARNLEGMLALFDGLDLDVRLPIDILMTVGTYVNGAALRETQEMRGDRDREKMEAGLTPEEIEAERDRYVSWFASSGHYPRIQRLVSEGIDPDAPETRDERFEFGLGCLLAGIAARIERGASSG